MLTAFIATHAARFGVYAGLLLFYTTLVWFHGFTKGEEKLFDYRDKQATESVKLIVKQGSVTQTTVTKYIRLREQALPIYKVIEKEVIVYANSRAATAGNSTHCLDPDWSRLHDAAAARAIPAAPGGTHGEGEAPTAAAALSTVTGNYAEHHACVDRLDALQEWVAAQHALTVTSP